MAETVAPSQTEASVGVFAAKVGFVGFGETTTLTKFVLTLVQPFPEAPKTA